MPLSWRVEGNENNGKFDKFRLKDMVKVCGKHGLLSKLHNGDYLPVNQLFIHFNEGVNCINIAPEFGLIETNTIINEIKDKKVLI